MGSEYRWLTEGKIIVHEALDVTALFVGGDVFPKAINGRVVTQITRRWTGYDACHATQLLYYAVCCGEARWTLCYVVNDCYWMGEETSARKSPWLPAQPR